MAMYVYENYFFVIFSVFSVSLVVLCLVMENRKLTFAMAS